jgi:hypothetical protein
LLNELERIPGFGLALSCDFLKSLGYVNFGKPDTILRALFADLGLSASDDARQVLGAMSRVAYNVGVTTYNVDMLFWLIGSGKFYLDGVNIGRRRSDFIEFAQARLGTNKQ